MLIFPYRLIYFIFFALIVFSLAFLSNPWFFFLFIYLNIFFLLSLFPKTGFLLAFLTNAWFFFLNDELWQFIALSKFSFLFSFFPLIVFFHWQFWLMHGFSFQLMNIGNFWFSRGLWCKYVVLYFHVIIKRNIWIKHS